MNKTIKHLTSTEKYSLRFMKIDLENYRIIVILDGSHAKNDDSSSQLGYVIFPRDQHIILPLLYKSHKSPIIVRSTLAAETLDLLDAADDSIIFQQDLYELFGFRFPIDLITDSKSIFKLISKGTTTSKKLLMIDIRATRESFNDGVINYLGCMNCKYNFADTLTKYKSNLMMKEFLERRRITYEVDQWIIRDDNNASSSSS